MAKLTKAYHEWLRYLKDRIRSAQIKAAIKVNVELLSLYWHLGIEILDKEKNADWGDKWLYKLANDLSKEFPDTKGFSHTNLKYIRRWTNFYVSNMPFGQQPVAQMERGIKGQQPVAQRGKKTSSTLLPDIFQQEVGKFGEQCFKI